MLGLGINRGATHTPWWPENAVMAIDFVSGLAMCNAVMRPWHELVSFARASVKFAPDSQGRWQQFAADAPAITDLGVLLEPAAANLVPYANGLTGWAPSRVNLQEGHPDPVGGSSACRVTITGDDDPVVMQVFSPGALAGRTFTHSIFARLVDAKGMSPGLGLLNYDGALEQVHINAFSIDQSWRRYTFTFTFGSVGGASLTSRLDPFNPQGDTVIPAAAIDVWGWQIEEVGTATSPVFASGPGSSRAADDLKLLLPAGTATLHLQYHGGAVQSLSVGPGSVDVPTDAAGALAKVWALP